MMRSKENISIKRLKEYAQGYAAALADVVKVLEDGTGGEGTTELQDATLGHYARKIKALLSRGSR